MTSDVVEARKKLFKQNLLYITHSHFLTTRNHWKETPKYEHLADFEPFEMGQWPSEFELHEVPEIPRQPLLEKPRTAKVDTITDFIKSSNIRGSYIVAQSALSRAQEEGPQGQNFSPEMSSQQFNDDG